MASAPSSPTTFPLHRRAWENDYQELDRLLASKEHNIEEVDPRGRTPLLLSVTLGHLESSRILLRHGANAAATSKQQWSVIHEATATGDPELLQLCLQYRDHQRYQTQNDSLTALLSKLKETPDFFLEMKWEFTSWVPLVSRLCPSDTYKVWKKGAAVRIDTTLIGFDNTSWERGNRSFIFKESGGNTVNVELDHDNQEASLTTIHNTASLSDDLEVMRPSPNAVAMRLTSPIDTTYIDTDKISFERSRSGIWGWRSDRTEAIDNHLCKVFTATNVELITKQRTEHLTEQDKKAQKSTGKSPIEHLLGIAQGQSKTKPQEESGLRFNPSSITADEYFNPDLQLGSRDIGRPLDQTSKVQKFKASLWLSEDYPLSLQEQVLPIIDLMAATNAHFRKLRDFITLQLPAGFPVKIEIPLFHVLNARVTFGNLYGLDRAVEGVTPSPDPEHPSCTLPQKVFEIPEAYRVLQSYEELAPSHHRYRDEDDAILQFAIQQSLVESGTENEQVNLFEALAPGVSDRPAPVGQRAVPAFQAGQQNRQMNRTREQEREERELQLALEYSLMGGSLPEEPTENHTTTTEDPELAAVLEMSRQQAVEEENRRRQEEEEELKRIIELSLTEK